MAAICVRITKPLSIFAYMAYKTVFNWSGGKDSALALYYLLQDKQFAVTQLLTSINNTYNRVAMHGIRAELLQQQCAAIGLPLQELRLNNQPSMDDYNAAMATTMQGLQAQGFTHAAYGDIFLEDLRQYREAQLAAVGVKAHFPLWQKNTTQLIHEFIDLGFTTIVCCVKSQLLDKSFAGRIIDKHFLKDLPKGVDPCGENGEFHTFVVDGPIFKQPIPYTIGETILRAYNAPKDDEHGTASTIGFWFCDILPFNK